MSTKVDQYDTFWNTFEIRLLFKKKKNEFQTNHGTLDATNAYPQHDTWHKTREVSISLESKTCAPRKRGTLVWIAGTVLLCKALFCFV